MSANGTVMPSAVPMTASSVVCDEGFQNSDLHILALSPDGEGAAAVDGKRPHCTWLLSGCEVCDSNSKLLDVSIVIFPEFMDLVSK